MQSSLSQETDVSEFAAQDKQTPVEPSADVEFRAGIILAVSGTFFFALKSIIIKSAFSQGSNATELLAIRMLLSAPFFVAVLISLITSRQNATVFSRRDIWLACGLGFFGYYLASLLDMHGLEQISAQLERLTLFTYPTMIAVLAWWFLGESLGWKVVVSLVCCYSGIFLMYCQEAIWQNSQLKDAVGAKAQVGNVSMGVFLVLASALSYSIYVVLAKPIIQRMGSRAFTCIAMLSSTVFTTCHFLAIEKGTFGNVAMTIWLHGLAIAFLCTVIPSFLVNEAINRIGATRTTVVGSIGPVVTMILAICLLGEPTSWLHVSGMLVVIFGVSFVSKK